MFDNVSLRPELVTVSEGGVLSLVAGLVTSADTLVSMSLFGRVYTEDPAYPDQFCPQ